jgi:hypothetical protein
MAKFVTTDYQILLGTDDFSDSIAAVTLEISADEQETTPFGAAGGFRTRIAGLKDASLSLDFHQDFGAGSVDATLFPLLGSSVAFTITPTSAAASPTNPSYSGTALCVQYSPFSNSVGDLATLSVTWPVSGEVTRGTGA